MSDRLSEVLAQAAERLGFEAARIWPQIVMVTWIKSLVWAIVDPIIVVVLIIAAICVFRYAGGMAEQENEAPDRVMVWLCAAIPLAIVAFAAGSLLSQWPDSLAGAFYPEAKTVLDLVKGAK